MNKNSRKNFYFSFICLLSSYFLLNSHSFGFLTHCREASFLFMVHFTVTAESLNILGCTLHIVALLKASFLKMDQCQPRPNCETQPLWVQGIRIVPNGHNLAGFAIGALHLAIFRFTLTGLVIQSFEQVLLIII